MKRSLFFSIFLFSFILLNAQYSKDYIKSDDINRALNLLGMNICKYSICSTGSFEFNLLYEEFANGKCVDSSRLISDESRKKLKNLVGSSLKIQKDTNFLTIFVQQKGDSLFTLNYNYTFLASRKEIVVSKARYGAQQLREFASPKITAAGKYPVLILSSSWEQKLNGETVNRFCFPENIEQIKLLAKHFYVLSVIAE